MPTPGRLIAFTLDYTAPPPVELPPVPGPDGLIDPPKILPASDKPNVLGGGVVGVDVILPVIDVTTTRKILFGHAVVTPLRHPDLTDGDALMDPAKGYPTATYDLSTILDGRGGAPLTYTITGVPVGDFSVGFVQDNQTPPSEPAPIEVGAIPPPPPPV